MANFQHPDFDERLSAAAQARKAVLDKFRAKVNGSDPQVLKKQAERLAVAQAREARIAEREAIAPKLDEVDREVEKIARQQREPIAALRLRYEKDGTLNRIASHIRTEKTLSFLFEHARKTA